MTALRWLALLLLAAAAASCNHHDPSHAWPRMPTYRVVTVSPHQAEFYAEDLPLLRDRDLQRQAAVVHTRNAIAFLGPVAVKRRIRVYVHRPGVVELPNRIRSGEGGYVDDVGNVHIIAGPNNDLPTLYHHLVHAWRDRDPWHQDPLWVMVLQILQQVSMAEVWAGR